MRQVANTSADSARRTRLWAEFLALFIGMPLAFAAFYGLYPLFAVLFGFTALAMILLAATPGFRPRDLVRGPVLGEWRLILGFAVLSMALTFGLAYALVPDRVLDLPRHQPNLWLRIMLLYPLLSAIPQEIIYRALFFRRYGELFPDRRVAIAVNGLAFALGHLFYQNPVAVGLTALSGLIFAWAYLRQRSFLLVVVLHALAGQIMFTSGLGIYFYHGAIGHTP